MQGSLSFIDIIGLISFIWSVATFYIGYRWYKDSATKDALIAKLTAQTELLRREVQEISSADGGQKRERLASLRAIDRQGLARLNHFYRAAYKFSRSLEDAHDQYKSLSLAITAAALLLSLISGNVVILLIGLILFPILLLVIFVVFCPFGYLVDARVIASREKKLRSLFDEDAFSYQETLAAKSWLDQQHWAEHTLKAKLSKIINERLTKLEKLGSNDVRRARALA